MTQERRGIFTMRNLVRLLFTFSLLCLTESSEAPLTQQELTERYGQGI